MGCSGVRVGCAVLPGRSGVSGIIAAAGRDKAEKVVVLRTIAREQRVSNEQTRQGEVLRLHAKLLSALQQRIVLFRIQRQVLHAQHHLSICRKGSQQRLKAFVQLAFHIALSAAALLDRLASAAGIDVIALQLHRGRRSPGRRQQTHPPDSELYNRKEKTG